MSLIIPYKEKELYDNEGAFIKPDGEIIYTYGLHETFSGKYCNGEEYEYLSRLRYGNTYDPNAFEYYKKGLDEIKESYKMLQSMEGEMLKLTEDGELEEL